MQAPVDTSVQKSEVVSSQENPFTSLIFNIVLPVVIMTKLSSPDRLGATWALLLGISFPLVYGLNDYRKRSKVNPISILGLISVLITGVFGIFKVSGFWFAVKEATIPGLIGLVVLGSIFIGKPLIKLFLYNEKLLHIDKINSKLDSIDKQKKLEILLKTATGFLAVSFFLSSVLNFYLAKSIVVSIPGSSEYIGEIGKFTGISYLVIALPSMIILFGSLWWLFRGIKQLTELTLDDIFKKN